MHERLNDFQGGGADASALELGSLYELLEPTTRRGYHLLGLSARPDTLEVDEGLLRVVAAAIEAAGAESAAPQREPLDAAQQAQPLHHQAAPQQAQPTQVATASHPPQLAAMAQPLRAASLAAPAGRRVLLSVGAVVPTQAASSALPPGWRRGRTQAATHDDEGSGSSSAPLPCPR